MSSTPIHPEEESPLDPAAPEAGTEAAEAARRLAALLDAFEEQHP